MTSRGEAYVAFDLGAESGRTMLGFLADGRLELQEVHRFANGPVRVLDSLFWDPLRLWDEMKQGMRRVVSQTVAEIRGIGVDTWGVDFGLVDSNGALLGWPYHYRDSRTEGMLEEALRRVAPFEVYRRTGSAGFGISTLCQLLAMRQQNSPALEAAQRLLMMPDLFNYWLTGRQVTEATIAGTTQFYDQAARAWDRELLAMLHLPADLPGEVVPSASVISPLLPSVGAEVGLGPVPVIAPACHDTPCAFAAAPAGEDWFIAISAGTWSVIGTELDEPLLTQEAMDASLLNEASVRGKILLAMNSMGLWSLQECRREWRSEGLDYGYGDLIEMAAGARPFACALNPDAPEFLRPGHMTAKIASFCQRTGQQPPADIAQTVRSLLEGLAYRYRKTIADLERVTRRRAPAVYLFGGGSRNRLLCQFTADATGHPVVAGPAEATATANMLLQALARGVLASPAEVRQVVRQSYKLRCYEPQPAAGWDEGYARFLQVEKTLVGV